MVYLITPSTVCKKFKIQLLAFSLVVSVHHISLRFLNLCIGYLLTTALISRFVASLFVLYLHINLIILVLCSAFDQIRILFILLLLAHCNYHALIKNHMVSFIFSCCTQSLEPNYARSAPTYVSFRKNLKTYLFNQAFLTQTVSLFYLTHRALVAILSDCSSEQVGFEPLVASSLGELVTCKLKIRNIIIISSLLYNPNTGTPKNKIVYFLCGCQLLICNGLCKLYALNIVQMKQVWPCYIFYIQQSLNSRNNINVCTVLHCGYFLMRWLILRHKCF